MKTEESYLEEVTASEYKYGFYTDIEADKVPPGLNEDVIKLISAKKNEPEWMTEWRLQAYRKWLKMDEPEWAHVDYPKVDYQSISYYSAPKSMKDKPKSLDEVDPELLRTYEKLGIPLHPSSSQIPRACEEIPWDRGSKRRQLLRGVKQRGVYRRLVCLYSKRRSLPYGTINLLPYKRAEYGSV